MTPTDFSGDRIFDVLSEIIAQLSTGEPLKKRCEAVLDLIGQIIPFQGASLFLRDEKTWRFEEAACRGEKVELTGAGLEKINSRSGAGDSALVHIDPRESRNGFRAVLSVPLKSRDLISGVICLGHHEPDYFNGSQEKLLGVIAGGLALAIDLGRLENRVAVLTAELLRANGEIEKQQVQLDGLEKYKFYFEITGSLNHTINNPLTIILGNLEMIFMRNPELDKAIAQKLRIIQDESLGISAIIRELGETKRKVMKTLPAVPGNGEKKH